MLKNIFCLNGFFIVLFCCLFFIISSCTSPKGDPGDGEKWYRVHKCFACHGDHGNNGGAPDIAGIDMGFDSFIHRLRNPRSATMPEYSREKISDQDAGDIFAYLKSLK